MALTTRTINPLHFEDLEPHRFEDLIRQLVYDFRNWHKLEATGRSGSDEGFDVRGWEIVPGQEESVFDEDESGREIEIIKSEDRIWLIQCKREKQIGPKKLESYLDSIPESERTGLYGLIFTASCDFSKKARDGFINKCREFGIKEFHLWGKGELEDLLYQPKNDHLLFAYFGISLQIRKRSLRAELRSKLTMKRKMHSALAEHLQRGILLRDPIDVRYPYAPEKNDPSGPRKWSVYRFKNFNTFGAVVEVHRHFAYINDDANNWDFVESIDDAILGRYENPWSDMESDHNLRSSIQKFWNSLPEKNRAWMEVLGVVYYEDVLDVDKLGDDYVQAPHMYVSFNYHGGPFKDYYAIVKNVDRFNSNEIRPNSPDDRRIKFFPDNFTATTDPTKGITDNDR